MQTNVGNFDTKEKFDAKENFDSNENFDSKKNLDAKESFDFNDGNYAQDASHKLSKTIEKSTKLSRTLEFQTFLTEVESLIAGATSMTSEELAQAKAKLKERIESLKNSLNAWSGDISQMARKGVTVTNNYVHEQPWTAVGVSTFVGLVTGCLLARRA